MGVQRMDAGRGHDLRDGLDVQAWKGNWAKYTNWTFTPEPTREMPEHAAAILSERETP